MFRRTTCGGSATAMREPYLEISRYDWAVSLGATMLLFSAFGAVVSIAEWFACGFSPPAILPDPAVDVLRHDSEDRMTSFSVEVAVPSVDEIGLDQSITNEVPDVTRLDGLESTVADVPFENVVLAIDDVSTPPDAPANRLPSKVEGHGNRPIGFGEGLSIGSQRPRGDNREARWVISHPLSASLHEYAQRLEAVGIQLAAADLKERRILYLTNATAEQPALSDLRDDTLESRMFLTWADGSESLTQADRDLFLRAGFDASESKLLHFLSPEAEEKLAALEADAAKGKDVRSIRRTEFGIQPSTEGFEFFVIRVLFR